MDHKITYLRTTSHRSRDRLAQTLGYKPQYYYTLKVRSDRITGGCRFVGGSYAAVPADDIDWLVTRIKGLTVLDHQPAGLKECHP